MSKISSLQHLKSVERAIDHLDGAKFTTLLHFPLSFPPDMMHCIHQNLLKQVNELWGGNLKEQAGVGLVVDLQVDLDEDGEGNDDGTTQDGGNQPSRSAPRLECVISKEKWKAITDIWEASRSIIPYLLGAGTAN